MSVSTESKYATIAANGTASVTFVPNQRTVWNVQTIAISSMSILTTTATVTHDDIFECQTQSGNADTANGSITLVGPSTLKVTWTNGTPGTQCTAKVRYEVN